MLYQTMDTSHLDNTAYRQASVAVWRWNPAVEEVDAAADYALDGTAQHSFRGNWPLPCHDLLDCLSGGDWLDEWRELHIRSLA